MFQRLYQHINSKVPIDRKSFETLTDLLEIKEIKKKSMLLRENEVCRFIAFVNKGCLRSYSTDDKGMDHVIQFAIEGWWISDLYSFFTEEPSEYQIEAIEDAQLFLISRQNESAVYTLNGMDRFFRLLLQGHYIATHKRITETLQHNARQRYEDLIKNHPDIANRVPQHMLASYLGITAESLSRIRRDRKIKK